MSTKESEKFKFGDIVWVKGYIVRIKTNKLQYWNSFDRPPIKAIFLGYRNLYNGSVEYIDHGIEGGDYYFEPNDILKGAWICIKNCNPMKVLVAQLEKV